ncbi:Hif1an, partial [Symbiodinium sp. CCMP2456]
RHHCRRGMRSEVGHSRGFRSDLLGPMQAQQRWSLLPPPAGQKATGSLRRSARQNRISGSRDRRNKGRPRLGPSPSGASLCWKRWRPRLGSRKLFATPTSKRSST